MPVPLEEKIEILTLLANDQDEETCREALQTLQGWNTQELKQVLSNAATPVSILSFAASHLVSSREDLMEALIENPSLTNEIRDSALSKLISTEVQSRADSESQPSEAASGAAGSDATQGGDGAKKAEEGEGRQKETLIQKISRMSAVEKIKAALTGNMEARMLLIRDSNKIVARAVLQSPKLSDSEIESYASAKNVSEEVLRLVASNRAFRKSYSVIRALVNNPRAPIDITLPLLNRLNEKDLKGLTMNKNVPEVLRTMTTKMIKQKEEAKKTKLPGKH